MKQIIPRDDILPDLRSGISGEELMRKFQVAEKGLQKGLRAVLRAIASASRQMQVESEKGP